MFKIHPNIHNKEYNTALEVLGRVGEFIVSARKNAIHVEEKSSCIDLVTATDRESELLLINGLKNTFDGNARFFAEENVSEKGFGEWNDDFIWIIDPIDGTMNFVHGFPHYCISLALYHKKEPVMGFIYNPFSKELYQAVKGFGAYLNEQRLSVSNCTDLPKCLLMMELGTSLDESKMAMNKTNFCHLMERVHGIRALGSCALNMAMVASGKADAYYEIGIHCWDIAAGRLIVEEAGGVCIDPAGE